MPLSVLASLVFASQLTAADLGRSFAPDVALSSPRRGSIIFQLFVAPTGVVEACDIVYSNWQTADAKRACDRLVGKEAIAAKTKDGSAVHGTVIFAMVSSSGDGPGSFPFEQAADVTLSVAKLPTGAGKVVSVGALVLVRADGTIEDCLVSDETKARFAAVACQQLQRVRPSVRRDANGDAVPYITSLKVDFVEEPTAG